MNKSALNYAYNLFIVIILVGLIAKCIYMLFGYGSPIDRLTTFGYAGGLILFGTVLPFYIYDKFFKRRS